MSLMVWPNRSSSWAKEWPRRWWRRLGDGEARAGLLRSAGAFGHQVIGGRDRRSDLLRSAGLNCADAIDGNVSGVRGLPGQGGGLPLLNRVGAHRDRSGWRRRWWWRWWRWRRCFLRAGAEHQNGAQSDDGCEYLQGLLLHVVSSSRLILLRVEIFSSSDEVFYFQLQFGCVLRPVKVN